MKVPVLAYPDPSYPFLLDTDASNVEIGAVEGRERPVAYFSSTLSQPQRNYSCHMERTTGCSKGSQTISLLSLWTEVSP